MPTLTPTPAPANTRIFKTYRRHNCAKAHRSPLTMARCIWRRAVWVHGQGAYAVIAYCRVTTVQLTVDPDEAKAWKSQIDRLGCGGFCSKRHDIVQLILPD